MSDSDITLALAAEGLKTDFAPIRQITDALNRLISARKCYPTATAARRQEIEAEVSEAQSRFGAGLAEVGMSFGGPHWHGQCKWPLFGVDLAPGGNGFEVMPGWRVEVDRLFAQLDLKHDAVLGRAE